MCNVRLDTILHTILNLKKIKTNSRGPIKAIKPIRRYSEEKEEWNYRKKTKHTHTRKSKYRIFKK